MDPGAHMDPFSPDLRSGAFPTFNTTFPQTATSHITYQPPPTLSMVYPSTDPTHQYTHAIPPPQSAPHRPEASAPAHTLQHFEPYMDLSFPPYSTSTMETIQPQNANMYGVPGSLTLAQPQAAPQQYPSVFQPPTDNTDLSRKTSVVGASVLGLSDAAEPNQSSVANKPNFIALNGIHTLAQHQHRVISGKSPLSPWTDRSARSTPDPTAPPPPSSVHDPRSPTPYLSPHPNASSMYNTLPTTNQIDPIEGLTERLGEFLFSPASASPTKQGESSVAKKKSKVQTSNGQIRPSTSRSSLWQPARESDGLTEAARNSLSVVPILSYTL